MDLLELRSLLVLLQDGQKRHSLPLGVVLQSHSDQIVAVVDIERNAVGLSILEYFSPFILGCLLLEVEVECHRSTADVVDAEGGSKVDQLSACCLVQEGVEHNVWLQDQVPVLLVVRRQALASSQPHELLAEEVPVVHSRQPVLGDEVVLLAFVDLDVLLLPL